MLFENRLYRPDGAWAPSGLFPFGEYSSRSAVSLRPVSLRLLWTALSGRLNATSLSRVAFARHPWLANRTGCRRR